MATSPERERLPDLRPSITHKFTIQSGQGDMDCYMTVGFFDEEQRRPGEVFLRIGKAGSTLNALLDTIGILTSYGLQYGIPLDHLCGKLKGMRFEPEGPTTNPDIPSCHSIIDYVFTWLERAYVDLPPQSG